MMSRRVVSATRRGQGGGVEAHRLLAHGFTERFDALVRIEAKLLRDGLRRPSTMPVACIRDAGHGAVCRHKRIRPRAPFGR
jgi:hypothetical protein